MKCSINRPQPAKIPCNFTETEVRNVIKKLTDNKSPGMASIVAEIRRAGGRKTVQCRSNLHSITNLLPVNVDWVLKNVAKCQSIDCRNKLSDIDFVDDIPALSDSTQGLQLTVDLSSVCQRLHDWWESQYSDTDASQTLQSG